MRNDLNYQSPTRTRTANLWKLRMRLPKNSRWRQEQRFSRSSPTTTWSWFFEGFPSCTRRRTMPDANSCCWDFMRGCGTRPSVTSPTYFEELDYLVRSSALPRKPWSPVPSAESMYGFPIDHRCVLVVPISMRQSRWTFSTGRTLGTCWCWTRPLASNHAAPSKANMLINCSQPCSIAGSTPLERQARSSWINRWVSWVVKLEVNSNASTCSATRREQLQVQELNSILEPD